MRIENIQNKLRQHISSIIRFELNNPKIGFVTIVSIKTSKDLDLATIYINVLGKKEKTDATLNILNKAQGAIKSSLAKKIKLRRIPNLRFVLDDTLENANRIEKIINMAKDNK